MGVDIGDPAVAPPTLTLPRKGGGKSDAALHDDQNVHHQYDFGRPSTLSAMKLKINWGLIGAMRGIRDSRR